MSSTRPAVAGTADPRGVLDEETARRIDEDAERQVDAAVAFADESP